MGGNVSPTSYPDYLDWKAAQHSFDDIAVSRRDDFNLTGDGEPERFSGLFVTASYFRVLKVPPKLGRTFFDEEDSEAGVNPIILSEHLWRSRFAADPAIVGRKLTLNTISCEVVGVAADSLSIVRNPETARNSQGARNADLYAPFGFYANRPYMHDRNARLGFYGIGRLKQGVSIEQAAADLKVIARNLELKYPGSNTGIGIAVTSLRDSVVGKYRGDAVVARGGRRAGASHHLRQHRQFAARSRGRERKKSQCAQLWAQAGKINHATAYRKCSPRIVWGRRLVACSLSGAKT